MSKVLILGASGEIGRNVAALLEESTHRARLFVRDAAKVTSGQDVFVGSATDEHALAEALDGIDIVFSNLGPYKMRDFAEPVVKAMKEHGTRRILWTATAGIYAEFGKADAARNYEALGGPPSQVGSYLYDQLGGADFIADSGLDYTIFRWNWLTNDPHVSEVVVTRKGEELMGGPISRRTAATFVKEVIDHPERYIGESLGVGSA